MPVQATFGNRVDYSRTKGTEQTTFKVASFRGVVMSSDRGWVHAAVQATDNIIYVPSLDVCFPKRDFYLAIRQCFAASVLRIFIDFDL